MKYGTCAGHGWLRPEYAWAPYTSPTCGVIRCILPVGTQRHTGHTARGARAMRRVVCASKIEHIGCDLAVPAGSVMGCKKNGHGMAWGHFECAQPFSTLVSFLLYISGAHARPPSSRPHLSLLKYEVLVALSLTMVPAEKVGTAGSAHKVFQARSVLLSAKTAACAHSQRPSWSQVELAPQRCWKLAAQHSLDAGMKRICAQVCTAHTPWK